MRILDLLPRPHLPGDREAELERRSEEAAAEHSSAAREMSRSADYAGSIASRTKAAAQRAARMVAAGR